MRLRAHCLHLAILACIAHTAHADEGLTQTTISVHAGGKPVGGLIFPIGAQVKTSAVANRIDTGGQQVRYAGNVQGRITVPAGEVVLFGEELVFSKEDISAERQRAVRDLEAMAASDQLYRGRSLTGQLSAEEWKQQTAIDVANMKRLAEIIDRFGWPGLRFAGAASQTGWAPRWSSIRSAWNWSKDRRSISSRISAGRRSSSSCRRRAGKPVELALSAPLNCRLRRR